MSQIPKYCQHFQHFKPSSSLQKEKDACCKYCLQGNFIWMCLTKGCGLNVCGKNNYGHLQLHLQESNKIKKFHPIFINITTAQIRCAKCNIEVGDLDIPFNQGLGNKQDPFQLRLKLLPSLIDLTTHKILGQLQNSQGHRRISKGLVGIFTNKYNYSINSALQFIAHSKFIKDIILQMKINQKNKMMKGIEQIILGIQSAHYRAINSNIISQQLCKEFPQLLGYKRKDPFQIILYLINLINDATVHYSLTSAMQSHQYLDQWDLFYKKNAIYSHHLIYDSISSTISLNYYCTKCQKPSSIPQNIQFLKLNIPKKKRKAKQIEKQLSSHRYTSPMKLRRNSLMDLFKQEEYPITVPQLIIELMKSPLHKEYKFDDFRLSCSVCKQQLRKMKLHLQKLPDILIMKIARISKQKDSIDDTVVQLSTDSLDMGSFTNNPNQSVVYDFQSAICIEKGLFFPIVVVAQSNKQKYVIRNEVVQLCKEKMNPYILCYRRRPSEMAVQKIVMLNDELKSQRQRKYRLPDFWYLQLQHGIQRPLISQLTCKHNAIKPNIQSKMKNSIYVSTEVYEDLLYSYKDNNMSLSLSFSFLKKSSSSIKQQCKLYDSYKCEICEQQVKMLDQRRTHERKHVLYYDKLKCQKLQYCMVSNIWIKRWSNFLYSHQPFAYMCKNYPFPGAIDNKPLLEGNKCKPKLVKNQDFKVVNVYLWMFLKEVYGGGPQIRYKWNQGKQVLDENLIADIKQKAAFVKQIYGVRVIQCPKKMLNSSTSISKTQNYQQTSILQPLQLQQDISIEEI